MDKTFRFFMSSQTKDTQTAVSPATASVSSHSATMYDSDRTMDRNAMNSKYIQNRIDARRKAVEDNYFYIMWHS